MKEKKKIPLGKVPWRGDHVVSFDGTWCTLSRGYYEETRWWWWYRIFPNKDKKFGFTDALTGKFNFFKNKRLYFTNKIHVSELGDFARKRLYETV